MNTESNQQFDDRLIELLVFYDMLRLARRGNCVAVQKSMALPLIEAELRKRNGGRWHRGDEAGIGSHLFEDLIVLDLVSNKRSQSGLFTRAVRGRVAWSCQWVRMAAIRVWNRFADEGRDRRLASLSLEAALFVLGKRELPLEAGEFDQLTSKMCKVLPGQASSLIRELRGKMNSNWRVVRFGAFKYLIIRVLDRMVLKLFGARKSSGEIAIGESEVGETTLEIVANNGTDLDVAPGLRWAALNVFMTQYPPWLFGRAQVTRVSQVSVMFDNLTRELFMRDGRRSFARQYFSAIRRVGCGVMRLDFGIGRDFVAVREEIGQARQRLGGMKGYAETHDNAFLKLLKRIDEIEARVTWF